MGFMTPRSMSHRPTDMLLIKLPITDGSSLGKTDSKSCITIFIPLSLPSISSFSFISILESRPFLFSKYIGAPKLTRILQKFESKISNQIFIRSKKLETFLRCVVCQAIQHRQLHNPLK